MDDYNKSTEMARKFDVVMELERNLDEIDKAFEIDDTDDVPELVSYLRFLVKELDDVFSGENEHLRYREFRIVRKGRNSTT